MKKILSILSLAAVSLVGQASAQTLVQWTFNSLVPDATTTTGITTPSIGNGTLTVIGNATSAFATGSPSDPASAGTDNSGLNVTTFATQGNGSATRGIQVAASTVGTYGPTDALKISFDFRQSGTVSRFWQLQASSDGSSFASVSGGIAELGSVSGNNTGTSFGNDGIYSNNPGGGSQTFVQGIAYTFPVGSLFQNNANFAFRFVAIFDPTGSNGSNYIAANAGTTAGYSTSGTARFDMVTLSVAAPVPEPTTWVLAGIGSTFMLWNLRRKRRGGN